MKGREGGEYGGMKWRRGIWRWEGEWSEKAWRIGREDGEWCEGCRMGLEGVECRGRMWNGEGGWSMGREDREWDREWKGGWGMGRDSGECVERVENGEGGWRMERDDREWG